MGVSDIGTGQHAFIYANGHMTDTGAALGATNTEAKAINDSGTFVGDSTVDPSTPSDGFTGPPITTIAAPQGYDGSSANDINTNGVVAGTVILPDGTFHAAETQGGQWVDIGALPTAQFAEAFGINDYGMVVGYSGGFASNVNTQHAFYYNGTMHDIGTLPGGSNSSAQAISNTGEIVGSSDGAAGTQHAFSYVNNTMTDLGTFGGGSSVAFDINTSDAIVGTADLAATDSHGSLSHAFIDHGSSMVDLNTKLAVNSGWDVTTAYGINDSGQIVGEGLINGVMHAFLMTPPH